MKQYYAIILISSAIVMHASEDKPMSSKPLPLTLTLDELSSLLHRSDEKIPGQRDTTQRLSLLDIKERMNVLTTIVAEDSMCKSESVAEPLSDVEKEFHQFKKYNKARAEWLLEWAKHLYMSRVEDELKIESCIIKKEKSQD